MSTWTNPIDRMPQIPQDWANHLAQGGLWSCALTVLLVILGLPIFGALTFSFYAMTFVSVLKKVVDYFKAGQTVRVCVGKAIVTVLWLLSVAHLLK